MPGPPVRFLKATNDSASAWPELVHGQWLFFDADWEVVSEPCRFLADIARSYSASSDTCRTYGNQLKYFFEACRSSEIDWKDITFQDLLGYRRLLMQSLGPRSINLRFSAIRTFYANCVLYRAIHASPFPPRQHRWDRNPLKVPETDLPPRAIPRAHLIKIFAQLDETTRLGSISAAVTGLRLREVVGLKRSMLPPSSASDQPFCRINLRRKGTPSGVVSLPLGLVDRIHNFVDFGERARILTSTSSVRRTKKDNDSIFLGKRGRALHREKLSKAFHAAVVKCGFVEKGYDFHGLRHTYAVTMLKQLQLANAEQIRLGKTGFNVLLTLRDLMGHKNIATTERYLRSLAMDEAEISDSIVMLYSSLMDDCRN